jgi:hypothetical protein
MVSEGDGVKRSTASASSESAPASTDTAATDIATDLLFSFSHDFALPDDPNLKERALDRRLRVDVKTYGKKSHILSIIITKNERIHQTILCVDP